MASHPRIRIALLTLVLLCASTAVARAQRPLPAFPDSSPPERVVLAGPASVPIELDRGLPMVSVRVNGRGPFRFGIETGARLIAVSQALVDSLALPPTGADTIAFRVDSISFGAVRLEGVHMTSVRTAQGGVDGLLGLPAFEELLLTIDYPAKRVVLERGALPEADGRDVLPIRRVSSFWGVPITLTGRNLTAILDTRSTGGLGLTPGDTAKVRWAGPLQVIGQARGAGTAELRLHPRSAPRASALHARRGRAARPARAVAGAAGGCAAGLEPLPLAIPPASPPASRGARR